MHGIAELKSGDPLPLQVFKDLPGFYRPLINTLKFFGIYALA
jgi:hypothetical protein